MDEDKLAKLGITLKPGRKGPNDKIIYYHEKPISMNELGELYALICKNEDELYPKPNEDTAPGILNNVISGRVANYFDIKGKNYNIDAGDDSFPCALKAASGELNSGESDLVFLLWNDKKNFNCAILGEMNFCMENNLPMPREINKIEFQKSYA